MAPCRGAHRASRSRSLSHRMQSLQNNLTRQATDVRTRPRNIQSLTGGDVAANSITIMDEAHHDNDKVSE